jgi:hypothetical protein
VDAGTLKIEFGKFTPATTTPVAAATYTPDATRELDISISANASSTIFAMPSMPRTVGFQPPL